ncbi:MFS transporter [candidate division KSB1 bacterium]|nr:MAG: MFS transporter [candidate division KSB1 bacterium]MCE7942780.1 MFS transporter [Chlorobi bacterium CHB1]MDL1876946.1 MFS transporter [Cytophagia bacterium CHB2]
MNVSHFFNSGALRHRNYRIFFTGQFISFVGTWMQGTAQSWLVYELTRSAVWLGLVSFLGTLPLSLFALVGGSVADRVNRRRLILATYTATMLIAALFAALIWLHAIEIHLVALLVFLSGLVNAFDIPARQALLVDLVGKEDLASGIALNSAMFNAARLLGPALGGLVVAGFGTAWCMMANALSFLAGIFALLIIRMHTRGDNDEAHLPLWRSLQEGATYVRSSPLVWGLLALVAVATIFGWSFTVLLPVFADEVLGGGAIQLGRLLSASGLGALAGAVFTATIGRRFWPRKILLTGLGIFALAAIGFALSRNALLSLATLAFMGFGLILFNVNSNSALQRRVPDHLRGRVMGFYVLCFGGLMPVGSLQIGFIAEKLGVTTALLINAAICGLATFAAARFISQTRQQPSNQPAFTSASPMNGFSLER